MRFPVPLRRGTALLFGGLLIAACDGGGGGGGGGGGAADTGGEGEETDGGDSQVSGLDGTRDAEPPPADRDEPEPDGPEPDVREPDAEIPADRPEPLPDKPVIDPDGGEMPCTDGETRDCRDIICVGGVQTCEGGAWSNCQAPTEICNGLDDDCDEVVDDGFEIGAGCTSGVGACQAAGVTVCAADGAGVVCGATQNDPQPEICNGIDDDCDGVTDGDPDGALVVACYTGPEGTEGVGECRAGVEVCLDGQPGACGGEVLPGLEVCNGLDDDCDGLIDEGDDGLPLSEACYTGPAGTEQNGLCRTGVHVCGPGGVYGPCVGEQVPALEICDQADNDCNGAPDDVEGGCACDPGEVQSCYSGDPATLDVGLCRGGTQTCLPDGSTFGPCDGQVLPSNELCDGQDNDCSGAADDAVEGVGVACRQGLGACEAEGTTFCDAESGQTRCDAVPGLPEPEICDSADNDCNGSVDDGIGFGQPCVAGLGACQAPGIQVCDGEGGFTCQAVLGQPSPEICDGEDNDCNGEADDGLNLGAICMQGIGACAGAGIRICDGQGGVVCTGQEGEPAPEICDAVDNDCDGAVDDGDPGGGEACLFEAQGICSQGTTACSDGAVVCTQSERGRPETCDGLDEDCDGVVDNGPGGMVLSEACYEGPAGTEGVGACHGGTRTCAGGGMGACQDQVVPGVEFCDSVDNDCNGVVDDVAAGRCECQPGQRRACYSGPAGTENVGLCHGGTQICNEDGLSFGPCQDEVVPAGELCDGLDNDCDNRVDDAIPGVGVACSEGVGDCNVRGVTFCDGEAGEIACGAQPGDPRAEACDGRDNDCDGTTDEDLGLGDACSAGVGSCRRDGVLICGANGGVRCSAQAGAPAAEVCDNADNDCDGVVDDGLGVGNACSVGVGACQRNGVVVCGADGRATCGAAPGQPQAEVCDSIDNDCDGAVDDGNPGGGAACNTGQLGRCSIGTMQCQNGGLVCVRRNGPSAEICDNVDNDCDGATDESGNGQPLAQACYTGPAGTQNVGICHGGFAACENGRFGACVGQVVPGNEICDGSDNNCDGTVDNPPGGAVCECLPNMQQACYTGPAGTAGVGLCRSGTQTCLADGSGFGPCNGEVTPSEEVCNAQDDDCNGARDDAEGVGQPCTSGTGACARNGQNVCDAGRGQVVCGAVPGQPQAEICDNVDNDCDGSVDDVAGLGDACQGGVGECRRPGALVCDLGNQALRCDAVPGNPQAEVCDGLDNDCTGRADDGNLPGTGQDCTNGVGECQRGGQTVCGGAQGIVCDAVPAAPGAELCDGRDNDCDGQTDDNPVDAGGACANGVGACSRDGTVQCVNAELVCDAVPGNPVAEACDNIDNDCDGAIDDGRNCTVYASCLDAYAKGERPDGVYRIQPTGQATAQDIWCDMSTDGGGWTLVASTRRTTLNDEASAYYADLATLAPAAGHSGVWSGFRQMGDRFDVRFACRDADVAANAPMSVDLTFYRSPWYREIVTSTDAASCFNEADGAGQDMAPPLRRNNLTGDLLARGDQWNFGYLEGEDACNDSADFTVDFDDRGMGNIRSDGTDWGEDDGARKCGRSGLATGQWFVFIRERKRVAVLGADLAGRLRGAGIPAEQLSYLDEGVSEQLDIRWYEAAVVGRYAQDWGLMTPELEGAIASFALDGGSLITEADGASILMSGYDETFAYSEGAPEPTSLFPGVIGGGFGPGPDTPVTVTAATDNLFTGVASPFSAGDATEDFFYVHDVEGENTYLRTVATFPGDGEILPQGPLPAILRGRYCAGSVVMANFDYGDDPAAAGIATLLTNMGRDALMSPLPALEDPCPLPLRPVLMLCGGSQRDVHEFLRGGTDLAVVEDCNPDEATQALLITRGAVVPPIQFNAATIQSYVRNGGIILTEYGTSDEVFNAVFGANVAPGPQVGGCRNAVNPAVQFNPFDTFWDENRFSIQPAQTRGCGFDMQGYPGITKIGGVTGATVSLAYRDLGDGRVWLIEADWGGNTVRDASFDPSRGLMHYMITHGRNPYDFVPRAVDVLPQ